MSVARTARRRNRQMVGGYKHLTPKRRPKYKKSDVHVAKRRLQQLIERERKMQTRSSKKK
jgi:hypothetical protein